jgi:hypothetical protein
MPEVIRLMKVHHAHKPDELIEAEKSFDPEQRFTERDQPRLLRDAQWESLIEGFRDHL